MALCSPDFFVIQYRAVADQVLFSSGMYQVLRGAVWAFILDNAAKYQHCTEGIFIDDFVKMLREERVSGTLIEIDAISHVIQYAAFSIPAFLLIFISRIGAT